ncbi:disease resistance (CC-NBS-LRR class) family protein, partial [Trifolium pratense]
FITSLTRLEVLDLRRCEFNELPIEIGKCSQLEELYASKCYPDEYVEEIIMDICILLNLQRFVLGVQIIPESTRVVQVNDFNISKLRTSNKNILQIAETISLKGLHGGCKNIIPDMVGIVGGMTNLSTLHLTDCEEIECIFDATYDFKGDGLISLLVELRLECMGNLRELCHGPPLQVLHYFEKLELLYIDHCWNLHNIFPSECKLQNLKILSLSYCKTDEVLFSESVAQSMQQLEQLTIVGCLELKHIIASSGSDHSGCNTSEEIIPAPLYSRFLMTNLRNVDISFCNSLESIFPICYVQGLTQMRKMRIVFAPKLEYVFGDECDHEFLSSHQNQNQAMLPHLEVLELSFLDNLIGMCPENCQAKWPSHSLRILTIVFCPKLAIPWFNLKVGYDQSQHHLNQIWSLQCLRSLTLGDCKELKCLFSIETHRSGLPELMELRIYNCQELKQIVAANEELVQIPNAELYFPKLKEIVVEDCNKLKSLFPLSIVTMLPQLSTLHLSNATQLQEVFRHSQGDGVMSEMEIVLPNLTEITLLNLPNFVDICHGCKLHAVEVQKLSISNCPKTASSLRIIQVTFLPY